MIKKGRNIVSKLNYFNLLFGIIGGVLFSGFGIFIIKVTIEKAPNFMGFCFGVLFFSIGLVSIVSSLLVDNLTIDKEKLVIKNVLGVKRIIYLIEITAYNEISKRNKYLKWNDLTLFTKDQSYKISSSKYSNYSFFKTYLISGKTRNFAAEKEWHQNNYRFIGLGFIAFGAVILTTHLNIHGLAPKNLRDFWFGLFACILILGLGLYLLKISKKL